MMPGLLLRFGLGLVRHAVARSTERSYFAHLKILVQVFRFAAGKSLFLWAKYSAKGVGGQVRSVCVWHRLSPGQGH